MEIEAQPVRLRADAPVTCQGHVLVVDDEEQNRSLLHDPLEALGYEVEEAENGFEALKKIALRPPDVVLLDVMMPRMDGFEVCRRLRDNPKTTHLPILMITALSERGDRLLGIDSGANDFLNKPVDVQDLILRVRNAIYAKKLRDQLVEAQQQSEELLLNILPPPIAKRMKRGETNIADHHPDVTVLVADVVGFTALSAHICAEQIVQLLNEIFSVFDVLVENNGLEKIKTIGDAYMVAGGLSFPRSGHAEAAADLALEMQAEIERLNQQYDTSIRLRIGICTGPVVAGVIGRRRFAYDIWGETVNLACRLESSAPAGTIQIAQSTRERLKENYVCEPIPVAHVPGQDKPPTYRLGKK